MSNSLIIFLGWLIALAIFFSFIVLLRYLHHRERMALISQGINPDITPVRSKRSRGMLRAGLITSMVGLSLTIGLYPLGFILPPVISATPLHLGPWLLPGLIPLGVGVALIISYYLEQNSQSGSDEQKNDHQQNVTSLEDHLERKRYERD